MKVNYKGFEVRAARERSMGGDILLFYSIFRISDGWELTSGFSSGSDRAKDFVGYLKERVDGFIADPREEVLQEHMDDEEYAAEIEKERAENIKTAKLVS